MFLISRGEPGIGNWTIQVHDTAPSFTGIIHSWQLILWGSSIDPSLTQPHPLPGSTDDPSATTIMPIPQPTISPPHESELPSQPTPSNSSIPSSGFWPWSTQNKMIWIYGSIAGIVFFISLLGVWYAIQQHKARLLRTHGHGREDYEFEVLPNEGGDGISQRQAGELYDAFADGEEYLKKSDMGEERLVSGRIESNTRGIGDGEMSGFLGDDDMEEDVEKGEQRRLFG